MVTIRVPDATALHDAHVDAYWADVDAEFQAWLDAPDGDDLAALADGAVAVSQAVGRITTAANAWRTGAAPSPYQDPSDDRMLAELRAEIDAGMWDLDAAAVDVPF